MALFISWMVSAAMRNIPLNTLATRVPRFIERARFMSLNSSVQHIGCAAGAIGAAHFLAELPDHRLDGMASVATLAMVVGLFHPLLLAAIERAIRTTPVEGVPLPPEG
jgi:hypothetical protein